MGCAIPTTVEGWERRLASERRLREASCESSRVTRAQPKRAHEPSHDPSTLLSGQAAERREVGEERHDFAFVQAVDVPDLMEIRTLVPPEPRVHLSRPSTRREPYPLPDPLRNTQRRMSVPELEFLRDSEDSHKFLSIVAVAPPNTISESSDEDNFWLPHHQCAHSTSSQYATTSKGTLDAENDNDLLRTKPFCSEKSCQAIGTFESKLDADPRCLQQDEMCRKTSSQSTGVSNSALWLDDDSGFFPPRPLVRNESSASSVSYNSALDTAEMIRANRKAAALQEFLATPASTITSIIKRKRNLIDSP